LQRGNEEGLGRGGENLPPSVCYLRENLGGLCRKIPRANHQSTTMTLGSNDEAQIKVTAGVLADPGEPNALNALDLGRSPGSP
jgi:hypothetical protein